MAVDIYSSNKTTITIAFMPVYKCALARRYSSQVLFRYLTEGLTSLGGVDPRESDLVLQFAGVENRQCIAISNPDYFALNCLR